MTTAVADFEAVLAQPPREPLRARTEVPLREVPAPGGAAAAHGAMP